MEGASANKIKSHKEKILSLWETRCVSEVPSAGASKSLALRNSLPIYLDHLSEALATNLKMDFRSVFNREKEGTRIGKLHGADRAGNRSYMLSEVIFEYHILREVIFQVLEGDGPLAGTQRDIVLDSVEQAVNDAAVEFSEIHTDIQQKFVYTLTHDLKNPITAAKLNSQYIAKQLHLPEAVKKSADRVNISLNRLEAMIHDLLDGSRLRAGERLSLQMAPCDLDGMIRNVVGEMAIIHGDRFVLDSRESVQGRWSSDGLRRAIENLIGNAVKYGFTDTPITVTLKRVGTTARLEVHNEGNPIPDGEIPLLFQDFRRAKSAQEGTEMGWGLGLTLVKGVVDAHQGRVWVESSEGKGTSFILEIPMREPDELSPVETRR